MIEREIGNDEIAKLKICCNSLGNWNQNCDYFYYYFDGV